MKKLSLIALLILCNTGFSQTVGIKQYDNGTYEGYSMMHPLNFDTTNLIDNCGKVINEWPATFVNSTFAEIREDGSLLRSSVDPNTTSFSGGGAGGILQEFSWNGNLNWQYIMSDATVRQHHDLEILPNGNILVIAWELKTLLDCTASGRTPGSLATDEMWPTVIYELEQVFPSGANIVWEWHLWDHLVQDVDPLQNNFGDVQASYDRVDINKGNPTNGSHLHVPNPRHS